MKNRKAILLVGAAQAYLWFALARISSELGDSLRQTKKPKETSLAQRRSRVKISYTSV